MTAAPWDWVPDPKPLSRAIASAAGKWSPHGAIDFRAHTLRDGLREAGEKGAAWLRHPCVSRVTQPNRACATRDVIFAAWVAGNSGCPGSVELDSPMVMWSPAGDRVIPAGRHDLCEIGTSMLEEGPVQPALDLWCRSTGDISTGSWAGLEQDQIAKRETDLARSISHFLALMALLKQRVPKLMAWTGAATRVVRPLVPDAEFARSAHHPDVPGLIEADLSRGASQTIELIVHETAHLHLRIAEAAGPLIDPEHSGHYHSPLRAEPRPLIGILLAYHALAYICAGLHDAGAAEILPADSVTRALADMGHRRDEARMTMQGAREHLTDVGRTFLERTHQVADYAAA